MNKTTKEELETWDKLLDEYENRIGMPTYMTECGVWGTEARAHAHFAQEQKKELEAGAPSL